MFGELYNLNRHGLFIGYKTVTAEDGTFTESGLIERSGLYGGTESNDTKGPWEIQVLEISGMDANTSKYVTFVGCVPYGAMFQEYATARGVLNRATCEIDAANKRVIIHNNRLSNTLSGWLWVILLRDH